MNTRNLFANAVVDDGRYRVGIVTLDSTVLENIRIIFGTEVGYKIVHLLKNSHPDGGYLIEKFCQFVFFIQFQPEIGFSMRLSDFGGNINFALDEYIALRTNEWAEEDRDKMMKLFQEIDSTPHDMAEIVIVDPLPLP